MTMTIHRSVAALLCVFALAGCDKNGVQDITGPMASARVKFFNFGVGAPGVNFYANDAKMTAISSSSGTESTNGVNYGGVGSGGYYSAIAPGAYTLNGRIAAATDKDLAISNAAVTIEDGKSYSYYQAGVYDTIAKTVDAFVVEDPVPADFDYDHAIVRFVNAISNSQPMTLYATNTTTHETDAIGGPVAYKSAGAFTPIAGASYDLSAKYEGSDSSVIVRTAVSFNAGRVYTIGALGDMTSTTTATKPKLDNTANR